MRNATEQAQLAAWRGGERQFPVFGSLGGHFSDQAARRPDAVAVRCLERSMTYGELDAQANRVAHRLVRLGVRAGDRVGLCAERSIEMLIGMMGILKVGAAYVPLDPAYPAERLAFIVADAQLLVQVCFGVPIELNNTATARINLDDPELADEPSSHIDNAECDSVAYVIYTSGSTGQPKGVEVTHANVLRLFSSTRDMFIFDQDDVWTLFHSYSFDFSVWEIWGALLYGGTIVVVPFAISRSPGQFLRLLASSGVTMLSQTPSAFRQLMEADGISPEYFPLSLKWVVFGGEALDPRSLARWVDRRGLDTPQLINMYGITETTVHVTFHRLTARDIVQGGSPIGRPLPDLTIDLVGEDGQLVAPGQTGEIVVGGAGVARGYLNRPELTAQRFVNTPHGYCYRSGDLARWQADGCLEFLGRIDQQVKIRGFRIEPGEIESALSNHPLVSEAFVDVRGNGNGARLIAWVVSSEWENWDLSLQLRDHLKGRLPDYMLPATIVPLPRFPLTANGKLDRHVLPDRMLIAESGKREAPQNALQNQIHGIWAEALGHCDFGIDDDFFDVGGHSLAAASVVANLLSRYGYDLPVTAMFRWPTVRAQAEYVRAIHQFGPSPDESGRAGDRENLVTLQIQGHKPPIVAVHGYSGTLFHFVDLARELGPDRPVFGIQATLPHPDTVRPEAVIDMAATYADQISALIPDGRMHLLGYSAGGWYAHAIATALAERGVSVISLLILDTHQYPVPIPARLRVEMLAARLWGRGVRAVKRSKESTSSTSISYLWKAVVIWERNFTGVLSNLFYRDKNNYNNNTLNDYFVNCLNQYFPRKILIPSAIFCPPFQVFCLKKLWNWYTDGQASCYEIFQDHFDFVRPDRMRHLAEALDCVATDLES